jgi:hypothetical protein
LKANVMQISIWEREVRIIVKYGFDWRYEELWDRY